MKIETTKLNSILTLLTNIIELKKVKPITELVQICSHNNMAYFGMTNNITNIVYRFPCEEELPTIVINVIQLLKLVKGTTTKDMKLSYKNNCVTIEGNGKYKVPIQTDEAGNPLKLSIKFPDKLEVSSIDLENFYLAELRNKSSVYPINEDGSCNHVELSRYYSTGENVISSNVISIAISNLKLPKGEYFPSLIKDFSLIFKHNKEYSNKYALTDDLYYLENENIYYTTPRLKNEQFPFDIISPFIDIDKTLQGKFSISKSEFKNMVKRLLIFSNELTDDDCIMLKAENNKLEFSTLQDTATEKVAGETTLTMKIKIPAQIILKTLQIMEDNITVYFQSSDLIVLSDSAGYYIIGGDDI